MDASELNTTLAQVVDLYAKNISQTTELDEEPVSEEIEEEISVKNQNAFKALSVSIQKYLIAIRNSNPLIHEYVTNYRKRNVSRTLQALNKLQNMCTYTNGLLLFDDNELAVNEDDLSALDGNIKIIKIMDNSIYISTDITITNVSDDDFFTMSFPIKLMFAVLNSDTSLHPVIKFKQYDMKTTPGLVTPIHPYINSVNLINPFEFYKLDEDLDNARPLSFAINQTVRLLNSCNLDLFTRPKEHYLGKKCTECHSYTYNDYVVSSLTGNRIHKECSCVDRSGAVLELSRAKLCRKCNNYSSLFIPVGKNSFECTECLNA